MGQDTLSFPSIHRGIPSAIGATLSKYRIIYLGYAVSMAIFITSSLGNMTPTSMLGASSGFVLDRMVYGTATFSAFMILYLIREQEIIKLNGLLTEELRLREGVRIAENKIRNQIILINQAAYVLAEKGEYDEEMVALIRDNTIKMDRELGFLQSEGVDPREEDDSMLVLF